MKICDGIVRIRRVITSGSPQKKRALIHDVIYSFDNDQLKSKEFNITRTLANFCFVFCTAGSAFRAGYVIGGEDAEITDWPFMVSLQDSLGHACGGVLYDSTHVVTAAHCVDGSSP